MNKRILRAGLLACLLGTASAITLAMTAAPAVAASGPSVSPAVAKALLPAQKALLAKDFAGAMALIKQAQAVPDQTPYDTYEINNFLANTAIGLGDYATADTAFEAMADSPAMPDADKPTTLHNAILLASQAKHFDKAVKYGDAYLALVPNPDVPVLSSLAQAYYFMNNFDKAQAMAQRAIDATPAGQPPNQGALEIKLMAQIKANQQSAAVLTLETIVTYYDDPNSWGQLIDNGLGVKGIKDMEALHIYRLRLTSHASGDPSDYTLPANLCLQQNMACPAESVAFLEAGHIGGKDLSNAQAAAARDRAVLPQFENIAKKGGGELMMRLAETYYGYGRYADAEATARAALGKGGAKFDPNEAYMLIGESLIMQGKTADAVAAFNSLKNPSPGFARGQHLWLLFANRKVAGATH